MASNLYEILELSKDATIEQIRKAYKKKALKTHPDRLPPGSTSEDKANAEEQFRKVNNAYEVLSDPQDRRVYDLHGVWPPPEPETQPPRRGGHAHHRSHSHHRFRSSRGNAFPEPLFGGHHNQFFTDPFILFDSIFGDLDDHFHDFPFPHQHHRHHFHSSSSRHRSPIQTEFENIFNHGVFGGGFHDSSPIAFPSVEMTFPDGNHGRWAGESFMTTTVNGVTQSVHKRRDWDGNEHVTRMYPDGREVHAINGVEQPPATNYDSSRLGREARHLPSPATVSQPHIAGPRSTAPPVPPYPPPPYSSHPGYANPPREPDYRRHDRRYSETRPSIPDSFASGPDINRRNGGHRNRWWPGGRQ